MVRKEKLTRKKTVKKDIRERKFDRESVEQKKKEKKT